MYVADVKTYVPVVLMFLFSTNPEDTADVHDNTAVVEVPVTASANITIYGLVAMNIFSALKIELWLLSCFVHTIWVGELL